MFEKIILHGKQFLFTHNVRDNALLRTSFNQLASKTFGLSFEGWYQQGYWGDHYIPYILVDNDRVVANASVNIIRTRWHGEPKTYIQLGTVMTDTAYRKQGLANFLIKRILQDWQEQADAIYLYANNTVVDFYPKYGFEITKEYQYSIKVQQQKGRIRKLNMKLLADKEILYSAYNQSNIFALLPMINNFGLLMFYCSQFMADSIYYFEDTELVAIVEYDDDTMICYDIFGETKHSLVKVLSELACDETMKVVLGFTPINKEGFIVEPYNEEDTTLFFYAAKENPLKNNQLMLPLLSHT